MDGLKVTWQEHGDNPIIRPLGRGWMIADPTVLLPGESPDGQWHLWANSIPPRLHHYVSPDGVRWHHKETFAKGAMRPYVRRFGRKYHLFYEEVKWWVPLRSRIVTCQSEDLQSWTTPREVLAPTSRWHGRFHRTVGNPCVVPWGEEYLLFFSAGTVFLRDCGFVEPRWLGLARSRSLSGPWVMEPEPILGPDRGDCLRNLGAGSIKVIPDLERGCLWGFNNGIYRDADGHSRSAIALIESTDGMVWSGLDRPPFLVPGGTGWKRALVYALDVRQTGTDQWHLYFNARDGWFRGKEQIGLAIGRQNRC